MAKAVAMDLLPEDMEEFLLLGVMVEFLLLEDMVEFLLPEVMELRVSSTLLKDMDILLKAIHLSKGFHRPVMVLSPELSLAHILGSPFLRAQERTRQWLQASFLRAQEHTPQWLQDNFLSLVSQDNFLNQDNIQASQASQDSTQASQVNIQVNQVNIQASQAHILNQVSQVAILNQASQAHIQVNLAPILKVLELPQVASPNQAMEALKAPALKAPAHKVLVNQG